MYIYINKKMFIRQTDLTGELAGFKGSVVGGDICGRCQATVVESVRAPGSTTLNIAGSEGSP